MSEQESAAIIPAPKRALAEAESAKAVQALQSAMVIAKRFPRNEVDADARIMNACKRLGLAEKAIYRYPRGGETVQGPSIRLLETLAQCWGNLDFGIKEIERTESESVIEAYCLDLETNTRSSKTFSVPHTRDTKKGPQVLKETRDIYEHIANMGARRMRSCIMAVIPGDVLEKAVLACKTTIAKGDGSPLVDRIKRIVTSFAEMGITRELLERALGHAVEQINGEEIANLQSMYNALKGGDAKRSDFFDLQEPAEGGKAETLQDRLKKSKETQTATEVKTDKTLEKDKTIDKAPATKEKASEPEPNSFNDYTGGPVNAKSETDRRGK